MKRCCRHLCTALILMLSGFLLSCSDDDGKVGNLKLSFVDLQTDGEGNTTTMQTDDGQTFTVTNPLTRLRPDTTYRYVVYYELNAGGVRLASHVAAVAGKPATLSPAERVTHPVQVESIWRSGKYINLVLNIKGKDGGHTLGFIDNGISLAPSGTRYLDLQLYHNAHNDREAYFHNVYASCLLRSYDDRLRPGRDSILFSVCQYSDSATTFRLPF